MSNKRKAEDAVANAGLQQKRQRRRRRSRSEPSSETQRRETMQRLFAKYCEESELVTDKEEESDDDTFYMEDPLLLDAIPECMEPEQLGFLLCAQETLRYLRQSGMSFRNTVYVTLRNRFVNAMKDLGIA